MVVAIFASDLDLPAHAQEQLLIELVFEQQNLPTDGRLRQVQTVSGGGEGASICHRAKNFQLPQVHREILCRVGRGTLGVSHEPVSRQPSS
jgi:hypothetical protein